MTSVVFCKTYLLLYYSAQKAAQLTQICNLRLDQYLNQILLHLSVEIVSHLKWKPDLEIYFQILRYRNFQMQILLKHATINANSLYQLPRLFR